MKPLGLRLPIWKKGIAVLISIQFAIGSTAWAGFASSGLRITEEAAETEFKFAGFYMKAGNNGMPAGFGLNVLRNGKKIGTALIPKVAKEQLKKFSPSNLRKTVWGNRAMNVGGKFVHIAKDSLVELPSEALAFFLALGIINFSKFMFDSDRNPLMIQEYIDSQKDPVGALGFYMFMLANRGTAGFLQSAMMPGSKFPTNNPNLAKFIQPRIHYLAMAAGMEASNLTREIHGLAGLKACSDTLEAKYMSKSATTLFAIPGLSDTASQITTGTITADKKPTGLDDLQVKHSDEICDKAYDGFMDALAEKGLEQIPEIASLLISAYLSGKLGEIVLNRAVLLMGAEVIFTAAGGWEVKLARYAYKVVQNTTFLAMDAPSKWITHHLWDLPVDNYRISQDLKEEQNIIALNLWEKMNNGWQVNTKYDNRDLDLHLRKFQMLAKDWRQFNLKEEYQNYERWKKYMSSFTSTYDGAKKFYDRYMTELAQKDKKIKDAPSLLDMTFPLAGVKPKPLEDKDKKLQPLINPDDFMYRQLETLISLRESLLIQPPKKGEQPKAPEMPLLFQVAIESGINVKSLDDYAQLFSSNYIGRNFVALLKNLPTRQDYEKNNIKYEAIGKSLQWLKEAAGTIDYYPGLLDPAMPYEWQMSNDQKFLAVIRQMLGDTFDDPRLADKNTFAGPNPLFTPGMGFLRAYEMDPDVMVTHSSIVLPEEANGLRPFKPSDYFINQMIFGKRPDRGESLVDLNSHLGYPAQFLPPKIGLDGKFSFNSSVADATLTLQLSPTIFNTPLWATYPNAAKDIKFPTIFDALRSGYIDRSILDSKGSLTAWWTKFVEPQFKEAWKYFDVHYLTLTKDIVEKLNDKSNSYFSSKALENNVVASLIQEYRLYSLVMGEAAKRILTKKDGPGVAAFTSKNKNIESWKEALQAKFGTTARPVNGQYQSVVMDVPLTRALNKTSTLDYQLLMSYMTGGKAGSASRSVTQGQNLIIQDQLEASFSKIAKFMKSLRVEKLELKNETEDELKHVPVITTAVRNKEYVEVEKEIEENLNAFVKLLKEQKVQASSLEYRILQASVDGILGVADELIKLGQMLNMGSYKRSEEVDNDGSRTHNRCKSNAQAAAKNVAELISAMAECRQ